MKQSKRMNTYSTFLDIHLNNIFYDTQVCFAMLYPRGAYLGFALRCGACLKKGDKV